MNGVTEISAALAEEMRIRILLLLWGARLCVKCIVSVLDSPQPTVSRHLSILRRAGFVKTWRVGMHTYYSLDFGGELGPLKRKLAGAFYSTLADSRKPYVTDRKRLLEQFRCDAECEIPTDKEKK